MPVNRFVVFDVETPNRYNNRMSAIGIDVIEDGRIVQEMYARGFEFLPIDIYRVKATHFSIIDGKIMPALTSIDGLGESAAQQIVAAAARGASIPHSRRFSRCSRRRRG